MFIVPRIRFSSVRLSPAPWWSYCSCAPPAESVDQLTDGLGKHPSLHLSVGIKVQAKEVEPIAKVALHPDMVYWLSGKSMRASSRNAGNQREVLPFAQQILQAPADSQKGAVTLPADRSAFAAIDRLRSTE